MNRLHKTKAIAAPALVTVLTIIAALLFLSVIAIGVLMFLSVAAITSPTHTPGNAPAKPENTFIAPSASSRQYPVLKQTPGGPERQR